MSDFIVWFDGYDEGAHRPRVGGKNAGLGSMTRAGLPVPAGFAVTVEVYETLRAQREVAALVDRRLARVDAEDPAGLQRASAAIREAVEAAPVAAPVERAVREAYEALCDRRGVADVPVAVRSSATTEDGRDASFAGQHDSFLWITGADAVVAHVRRCWSSAFTARALAYRHAMGYDHAAVAMAVGVQQMVAAKAAGVAFTLNPMNGDRSQVAIDASWGFGEAVASGEVTPDTFVVDKVLRAITARVISPKAIEYRLAGGGVAKCAVEAERQRAPCLTDDEACAVAALARRAEQHYGRPQDVEWALDRHLPDGENVLLLQARPETVWSRRAATPLASDGYDPMRSIVATLTAPLRERGT